MLMLCLSLQLSVNNHYMVHSVSNLTFGFSDSQIRINDMLENDASMFESNFHTAL